jgi:hypothetical protein
MDECTERAKRFELSTFSLGSPSHRDPLAPV